MKENEPEPSLEDRIQTWILNNPERAGAGRRMLEQLMRIRNEFSGDTRARLEALVDETLQRHERITESRRAGLQAAKELSETVERLTTSMSDCLLSAKKAHEAAIGAAMSAMTARARMRQTNTPWQPAPKKKLVN
jgi:hypothetical protein